MYRIDSPGSVDGHWQPPNPQTGVGTVIAYDWLEEQQEEGAAVVEGAGLTLQKGNRTQLLEAILWHVAHQPVRPEAWDFHVARAFAWGAGLVFEGLAAPMTIAGTPSAQLDGEGRWLRTATGAIIGAAAGAITPAFDWWQARWDLDHTWRVRLQSIADVRLWVGLFDLDPTISSDHATRHVAGFRFATDAGDTSIVCYSASGSGVSAITPSGIAPVVGATHLLRIAMDYTPSPTVRFWIDDVLVATHTARIPSPSAPLGGGVSLTALSAAAKSIDLSRADMRNL